MQLFVNNSFFNKTSFTFLHLHFIVFILGFTAILGKIISLDAISLVLVRTFFAAIILLIFMLLAKKNYVFNYKTLFWGAIIGAFVALHWLSFFHAIKISNVAVTLGCLSTSTLFVALLEPLFLKKKISTIDIIAAVIIVIAIYIIFRFEFRFFEGIIFAITSAFLAAVFSVLNKVISSHNHNVKVLALSELFSAFVVCAIILFFVDKNQFQNLVDVNKSDLFYLFLLASVGTSYAFTVTIELIKKLNAFVVVLAINMEPIYGILFAYWIFGESEKMTPGFYFGAVVILATVVFYSIYKTTRK